MIRFAQAVLNLRRLLLFSAVLFAFTFTFAFCRQVFAEESLTTNPVSSENDKTLRFGRVISDELYRLDFNSPPKHITINLPANTTRTITRAVTVRDVLIEQQIPFDSYTLSEPDFDTSLEIDTEITLTYIMRHRQIKTEKIPFESMTIYDNTLEIDTITTAQEGREGLKKVINEQIFRDGVLDEEVRIREEIIRKSQDEIIALGTKKVFRTTVINGVEISYWKRFTVFATSYGPTCEGCSPFTATGAKLRYGICATDPRVIPLGTVFYVPGYGQCLAADVGGAIKGNKIDLGYEDLSNPEVPWSARYVEIYITSP